MRKDIFSAFRLPIAQPPTIKHIVITGRDECDQIIFRGFYNFFRTFIIQNECNIVLDDHGFPFGVERRGMSYNVTLKIPFRIKRTVRTPMCECKIVSCRFFGCFQLFVLFYLYRLCFFTILKETAIGVVRHGILGRDNRPAILNRVFALIALSVLIIVKMCRTASAFFYIVRFANLPMLKRIVLPNPIMSVLICLSLFATGRKAEAQTERSCNSQKHCQKFPFHGKTSDFFR